MDSAIFSFFSGAGFLDLGFETSGFKIAYVNEKFTPFADAYRYSRQALNISAPEYGFYDGDISDFTGEKKNQLERLIKDSRTRSEIIGFVGGPPCPDFSVGGKNRGQQGDNGKLSATYINLVCEQLPDFFLFENVKGLWRTQKHRTFYEEMKKRVQDSGFITTEKLVNAIEYGVPQDRDRIILIGFRESLLLDLGIELHGKKTLSEGIFPWVKHRLYTNNQISLIPWPKATPFTEDSTMDLLPGIPEELTVEYWFHKNSVNAHPNAMKIFTPRAGIKRFQSVDEGDDSKKSYKRLHRWRYSPTACYGNNEVHLHPYKARRISVSEALSLQSLPREFSLPQHMSLTNMFKTVGNGVPYLLAQALARTILDFLTSSASDREVSWEESPKASRQLQLFS
jgi:DNA (cytosine-5)-methyltransferase 1